MRKNGKHNIFYVILSMQIYPVLFLQKKRKNIGLGEKKIMLTLVNMT
jgi:hypothetical protein